MQQPTLEEWLKEKFPGAKPIKQPPALATWNGVGVGMYGRRNVDQETSTYVKSHCLCLIFIPVLVLGAYRVSDAPGGGWYFIAREKVSGFAKYWNISVLLSLLVLFGWAGVDSHYKSPAYLSKQALAEAGAQMKEGKWMEAAGTYRRVYAQFPQVQTAAKEGITAALSKALAEDGPGFPKALAAFASLAPEVRTPAWTQQTTERAQAVARQNLTSAPRTSWEIANTLVRMTPQDAAAQELKIEALKAVVSTEPAAADAAEELALHYESKNQPAEARAVLYPVKDKLGGGEGARILGRILVSEGKSNEAYPLLSAYVEANLGQLHKAETAFEQTVASVQKEAVAVLESGGGSPSFYSKYKKATEEEQSQLVSEQVTALVEANPHYQRALKNLQDLNAIVPVALDFGIAQIERAQATTDPEERRKEFEAAEKTLLSVRSFAAESEQYKMFLGEVYYWLGKFEEGKQQFDELLASSNREPNVLVSLAHTLRAVGATPEARAMAEEAYGSAKDAQTRYRAAGLRAVMYVDADDRIAWLKKGDSTSMETQISLNEALAHKALVSGDSKAAEACLRKALAAYDGLPRSAASLNNSGLSYLDLYGITGLSADLAEGIARLEEAIQWDPGDSVLLINTANALLTNSIFEVTKDKLRFDLLKLTPDVKYLHCCYESEAELEGLIARMKQTQSAAKGLVFLEKALLLRPKDPQLYEQAEEILGFWQDTNQLQRLDEKLTRAQLDLSEYEQDVLARYAGEDVDKMKQYAAAQVVKMTELLQQPDVQASPATYACAATILHSLKLAQYQYGASLDSDALVKEAEAVDKKYHLLATRWMVGKAYLFAVHANLMKTNAEYALMAKDTRTSLDPTWLVGFAVDRGGPVADAILADPMFKKAVEFERGTLHKCPSATTAFSWALQHSANAAEGNAIKTRLMANQCGNLERQINYRLHPLNTREVLSQYWALKLAEKNEDAAALFAKARSSGVPLPPINLK